MDLARFIFEYLSSDIVPKSQRLQFEISNEASPFEVMMRPIEITILLDNLISNAIKAHARLMHFSIRTAGKKLTVIAANDGEVVSKGIVGSMFELGISGRGGSGIGLYTCREIVTGMGGKIECTGNDSKLGGAKFEITFFA
jgi:signal transduction histidine kinase